MSQPVMIEPEPMQQRRVQVVDVDDVGDRRVSKIVGCSMHVARLEAAPGDPERKRMAVVVAAVGSLRDRQTSKFAGPHYNRVFQQPALLEIFHQRGTGLIGPRTQPFQAFRVLAVRIPRLTAHKDLHEPDATFDQPPSQQAPLAIFFRFRSVETVHFSRGSRFTGEIQHIGNRSLHAGGRFEIRDPRSQLTVFGMLPQVLPIQRLQQSQLILAGRQLRPFRRPQIEDRRRTGSKYRPLIHRRQPAGTPVLLAIDR